MGTPLRYPLLFTPLFAVVVVVTSPGGTCCSVWPSQVLRSDWCLFCSVSEKQNLISVPGRPFESLFLRSFSGFCGFPHFIDVYFSPHRPHFCVQECLWSVVILLAPSRCKHTRGHHAVPRARGRGRYPNTPANDDGNTSVMHFAA